MNTQNYLTPYISTLDHKWCPDSVAGRLLSPPPASIKGHDIDSTTPTLVLSRGFNESRLSEAADISATLTSSGAWRYQMSIIAGAPGDCRD